MRKTPKALQVSKSPNETILTALLCVAALIIAFAVVNAGQQGGFVILAGVIGLGAVVLTFIYPAVGFYGAIGLSFFYAEIKRILHADIPLGTLIDLMLVLTFASVIIRKVFRREPLFEHCNHPVMYAYLVLMLYSLVQVFNPNGGPISANLVLLRRFFALQMFLYTALEFYGSRQAITSFFRIWFGIALLAGIYGVYQQLAGYPAHELEFIMSSPRLIALYSAGSGGTFRKFSFMADPTSYGILMAVTSAVFLVFLLMLKKSPGKKLIISAGIGIMLLGMSFSGTRTATAAFCAAVALYVIMTISNWKTMIFAAVGGLLFAGILFAPIEDPTIDRIRSTFEVSKDASMNVRDQNRHEIQPYLHAHPIGGGLGTTGGQAEDLTIDAGPGHPLAGFPTDSGFLKMALEYGWIGLIILCVTFLLVLISGVRAYYRSSDPFYRMISIASVVGVFAYVVSHVTQVSVGTVPGAFLYYSLIAMVIRIQQSLRSEANQLIPKPVI